MWAVVPPPRDPRCLDSPWSDVAVRYPHLLHFLSTIPNSDDASGFHGRRANLSTVAITRDGHRRYMSKSTVSTGSARVASSGSGL